MQRHFTISRQNLKEGRAYTLITAAFSHSEPPHLVMNLVTLNAVAPFVLDTLGRQRFWTLFLTGAAAGNTASVWINSADHFSLGRRGER